MISNTDAKMFSTQTTKHKEGQTNQTISPKTASEKNSK
jgi:hypothetical protein